MSKKILVVVILLLKLMKLETNFFYKVKEKKCENIFFQYFFVTLALLQGQIS